jgi:hypothetical protein
MAGSRHVAGLDARDRTPHENNFGIDFESAYNERRALLLSALARVRGEKYAALALVVFAETDGRPPLKWSLDRLAAELGGVHRNTARNWRKALERFGVLVVGDQAGEENCMEINWQAVRSIAQCTTNTSRDRLRASTRGHDDHAQARDAEGAPTRARGPGAGHPPPGTPPPGGVQGGTRGYKKRDFVGVQNPPLRTPPESLPLLTPNLPARALRLSALPEEWRRAGWRLKTELGMGLAAAAAAAVRDAGGTPDVIEAVIEHVLAHTARRPGGATIAAWGPGAVYRWLTQWEPGQAADDDWPPKSDAWIREQQRVRMRDARLAHERERAESAEFPPNFSAVEELKRLLAAKQSD